MAISPAIAHHSDAGLDMDALTTIEGVVTEFGWRNPHIYIALDVADEFGETVEWNIQTGSTITFLPYSLEEALRYDSPVQLLMRLATADTSVRDVPIPKGSMVIVLLGSANRDAAQFPDPDRFDIERNAQGHLALGYGNHFCLGASLARLEARIALETLLTRFPDAYVPEGPVERHGSFLVRGPKQLPYELGSSRGG